MTEQRFVPHFDITTIAGERSQYADIWQKRNLLLVLLPPARSSDIDRYVSVLRDHTADLQATETACVITEDHVLGLAAPAIVIADRWGEIAYVAETGSPSELPAFDSLIDWLRHLQNRCPECEGEAR
jgi:hypothetical protein